MNKVLKSDEWIVIVTTMSLRKDIEALKVGQSLETEQARTAVYVAAKRAGVTVTTEVLDSGKTLVTLKGQSLNSVDSIPEPTLLERVQKLSVAERLELFEQFELCCGMNRGSCICPAEEIEVSPEPKDKIAALRELMSTVEDRGQAQENVEIEWSWSQRTKAYKDEMSGDWYRQQYYLDGNGNPVYRTVVVDEEDLDSVKRVK